MPYGLWAKENGENYMENELKYFNDEGLEYLLRKNEENIEAMKEVHAAIMEEIERRKCAA